MIFQHGGAMTVYIEYVLIDNFVIDFLLLKSALMTTATPTNKKRLVFSALLGAGLALFYPLIEHVKLISVTVKILCAILMVLVSAKHRNIRSFYLTSLLFLVYTFISGGAITGLFNLFNIEYSNEISIAFMIAPVYLVLKVAFSIIKHLVKSREVLSNCVKIEIEHGKRKIGGVGFFDTGNCAFDGDRPIIVCGKAFALKLLGSGMGKVSIKKVEIITVNGKSQNSAIELDKLWIYNGDEPNIFNNVTLCVSKYFIGDGYDVILHPSLMEDLNDKRDFEIKKVS